MHLTSQTARIVHDYIREDVTPLSVFIALPDHLSVQYDLSDECQFQTALSACLTTKLPE